MKINALFLILVILKTSLGFAREKDTFYETDPLNGRPSLVINGEYYIESDNESEKTDDSMTFEKSPLPNDSLDKIHILPLYNPMDAVEKTVDHYILEPILYLGGSTTILGGFLYYYNQVGMGTIVMEVGLGIIGSTLFLKSVFRLAAGASRISPNCLRYPISK